MTLRLEKIRAGYGRIEVLHEVDLVVPPGSAVALLGANGAGKTTLLKVAAGLVKPRRGTVRFGEEGIDNLDIWRRSRRGVCMIPEGRAIFRQLSVRENLVMYLGGRRVAEGIERATAAFEILGKRLDQMAGTLSGGEQQMLALSRALVSDAELVLADELSVGLAPVIIDQIFAAVKSMAAEGRSLLIVEQYVDRALDVADYVYILNKGQVVFVGEPEQCHDHRVFEAYMGASGEGSRRHTVGLASRNLTQPIDGNDK